MNKIMVKRGGITLLVAGLLVAAATLVVTNDYYATVAFTLCFWCITAAGYNLSSGYAGELSLGHGVFLGIGAYSSSLFYTLGGVSPWLGMLIGVVIAAGVAFLLGIIAIRLKGVFFAIVTLAILLTFQVLAYRFKDLTNGAIGVVISGEPSFANFIFEDRWSYVLIIFVSLIAVLLLIKTMVSSRMGYELAAYRENEDAALSLGISTIRVRVIALVVSGAITAFAGSLWSQYYQFIDPGSAFSLNFSIQVALMAIVGGFGSLYGPLYGATLIVLLGQLLQPLTQQAAGLDLLVYGLALIVTLLFFPKGLTGFKDSDLAHRIGRRFSRKVRNEATS